MKKWVVVFWGLVLIPAAGFSQNTDAIVTIDSRIGYSSNSILNPFFGIWNNEFDTGYGMISPMGQLFWNWQDISMNVMAGGVFEPFFNDTETLTGGFGLFNSQYRIHENWTAGVESGASLTSGFFERSQIWIQPAITWSPTLFTNLRFKAGSSFLDYENPGQGVESKQRFDLYSIELESWPSFNWQIKAGLYGRLDQPADNISLQGSISHLLTRNLRLSIRLQADRYSYELLQEANGGPPIGLPGGQPDDGQDAVIADESDRMIRFGFTGLYQLNRRISFTLNLDHINLYSGLEEVTQTGYQVSGGVRLSIRPTIRSGGKAEPQWAQNDQQTLVLKVNYSGDGQLYIVGDFNNWEKPGNPLVRQSSNRYVTQLALEPGAYEYKILIIEGSEERWVELTDEAYTVNDGFSGKNGIVFID